MNSPLVSVVMATYNYGHFIGEAIESVLQQTFADFELVIVDDGSTDNTAEVVQPYLRDARVRLVRQGNAGVSAAKNRCVEEASAPLIALIDADDVWLTHKLEKQVPLFSDPDVGVVFSLHRNIDQNGRPFEAGILKPYRGDILKQIFVENFVPYSSAIVRRECFEECGAFRTELDRAVDYDLWIRIASRYKYEFVNERLILYRSGHAQISTNHDRRFQTARQIRLHYMEQPDYRRKLGSAPMRRANAAAFLERGERRWIDGDRVGSLLDAARSMAASPSRRAIVVLGKGLLPRAIVKWLGRRLAPGLPDSSAV